jgi:hypothetical protein
MREPFARDAFGCEPVPARVVIAPRNRRGRGCRNERRYNTAADHFAGGNVDGMYGTGHSCDWYEIH